jgi:DNA repair protein RAD7
MQEKAPSLSHLTVYAANLVSDEAWKTYFSVRGPQLETLKLQWLDSTFDKSTVQSISENCNNLKRLKLYHCRKFDEESLNFISDMGSLEHLSLQQSSVVIPTSTLTEMVPKIIYKLKTLSLLGFYEANDDFLDEMHSLCRSLNKLRIAENDLITDAGITALFHDWLNPPLERIDLSATRDVDNSNPDGPEDTVGLGDSGLKTIMQHSGTALRKLNISSCRHITTAGFMEVFNGIKTYPELREIDLSFCDSVDTVVVAGIFKTCPKLQKLVVFGCFGVDSIVVPAGVLVIGAPKAQDAIEQFGNAGLNVEQALGGMLQMISVEA